MQGGCKKAILVLHMAAHILLLLYKAITRHIRLSRDHAT
jgi:hypothetical protein